MNADSPSPHEAHDKAHNSVGGDVSGTSVQGDDIHGGVHVNNGGVHVTVGQQPPSPPLTPRPMQVNSPPHDFVNRESYLDWINGSLNSAASPRVVVCEGPRGIGKTTLIRKVAEAQREYFTGGQLSFEYRRGHYDHHDQAITGFLRTLGMDKDAIPNDPFLRAKEYLTRTQEQRLLVVIEGAWEPAQVRALVPGGEGSLVLVSGDGPDLGELQEDSTGAQSRPLTPLEPEPARALLASRASDDLSGEAPGAVDQLLETCAGLPLAIALVGGRLCRTGPGTAADLVAEIRHTRSTLRAIGDPRRNLEVIFQTAYQALSPEAAALYRALGDWPAPVLDRALLPGIGDEEALSELLTANVVEEAGISALRFRHDLIRTHARDRAVAEDSPQERRRRLEDLLDAYLVRLGFAELAARGERLRTVDLAELLAGAEDPFRGDTDHARNWLLGERATLLAVVLDSADRGLHTHAHRFAELATALYLDQRLVHDWATTATVGADSARLAGDAAAEARLNSMASRPLIDLGRRDEAGERLARAVELAADLEHSLLRASVWEFQGRYLEMADPEAAVAAFDRCVAENRASDDPASVRGEALGVLFRGHAKLVAGQAGAAVADIEDALEQFAALPEPDKRMRARGRVWLGSAYAAAGRDKEVAATLKQAIKELEKGRWYYYKAEAHELLADHYEALGAQNEVRAHLEAAERHFRDLGSPRAREFADRLKD
ncbi:NB-ARC domain-containing protein [Nocardiopsis valliformis]|uniref:NB-ARC domain-containing protein n=1 Tax=Nocardiopsis valliformis TaxID=239974 RepID=UPI0003484A13|nr:NB-ARC domain-containing protein [Nocardiopsis valliformis]